MATSTAKQCEKKSTLSRDETIRKTLLTLQEELKNLPPSVATQNFQKDISFVEQEYNKLPDSVAEYEAAYPGFQQSGSKYNKAECEWNEITKWDSSSNSPLSKKSREAIKKLREESYRDGTEEPLNNNHPKKILEKRNEEFLSIKSCLDQRQAEDEQSVARYNETKAFTKTADGWFTELTTLHGQTKGYNDKKKYGPLHAVYLEAEQVWKKINDLAATTPADLKKKLMDALWDVLQAKDERFRWHQDWLYKQQAVTTAQTNYDTFKVNRRKDLIWEAEDLEAADGETTNGGTDYGTGQVPTTYAPTTPVGQP